jgi:Flp pilus assembly protein TadG
MRFRRNEDGQAIVLSVLALVAVMGMCALVLDVGSWFRTHRRLQATADAAALAGAQSLPTDPSGAKSLALSYANKNGGDVLSADIVVSSTYNPNDTISVKAERSDSGSFTRVLGIVTPQKLTANAKARVDAPQQAMFVAPMVVNCNHPLIQNCNGNHTPTFGVNTNLNYDPMGAPGAFGMLNLDPSGQNPGTSEEANWILHGWDQYLGLGDYRSDPGAKFSSSNIQDALQQRVGTVLLFPVFRTLNGTGQNAEYDIIGWIGFRLASYDVQGNNAILHGTFETYIAHGILAQGGSGSPPTFGVKSIQLIG